MFASSSPWSPRLARKPKPMWRPETKCCCGKRQILVSVCLCPAFRLLGAPNHLLGEPNSLRSWPSKCWVRVLLVSVSFAPVVCGRVGWVRFCVFCSRAMVRLRARRDGRVFATVAWGLGFGSYWCWFLLLRSRVVVCGRVAAAWCVLVARLRTVTCVA
jgi:hypothetical protein